MTAEGKFVTMDIEKARINLNFIFAIDVPPKSTKMFLKIYFYSYCIIIISIFKSSIDNNMNQILILNDLIFSKHNQVSIIEFHTFDKDYGKIFSVWHIPRFQRQIVMVIKVNMGQKLCSRETWKKK